MIVKGIWYPEMAENTQGSFVTTCQFLTKNCDRPAMGKWSASTEERPKLLEKNFTFGKGKFSFTGNIPVFDWIATVTGDFGVEHSSDLVEQPGIPPAPAPASEV